MLAAKCGVFLNCYESASDHEAVNAGERALLAAWSRFNFGCILDVGANVGIWALMAHDCFPECRIHCFEIMASTAEELRRKTADIPQITVNGCGLLDHEGEIELRYFPGVSTITTMTAYPHQFECVLAKGRVVTGDGYIERHGIDHVDMIKLDVEGAESLVLKGLAKIISEGRVDVVQFEYGQVSILTKYLLQDFYNFFTVQGYRVGKIYPDYVEFRDYAFEHEDFRGSNYVAVRADRSDLIAAVS